MFFACRTTNEKTGKIRKKIVVAENKDEAARLYCRACGTIDKVSIEPIEEVEPTRKERKEWKEYLYNMLMFLATERYEFRPRKKNSLYTMLESYLCWADEYNDGYFPERDDVGEDRFSTWLAQEFDCCFATESYYAS